MPTTGPTPIAQIAPIGRREAAELASVEYTRLLELLRGLSSAEFSRPTDCGAWDVRALVAHLLGAAEAGASIPESLRQLVRGARAARRRGGGPLVDGINEVQVGDRAHLGPQELVDRLTVVADATVRGRQRTPGPLRRVRVPDGIGGRTTMGFLLDVVYTRDVWLHRIDIARATDRDPVLTTEHDARLVADVVAQWAGTHGRPVTLALDGPAGGTYVAGDGGERLEEDAVEFCRALSGRREATGLLATPVPF